MSKRTATIARSTKETDIKLKLDLDGTGKSKIETKVGFFDHMLTLLARHGLIDLEIQADGDLEVDHHHTVEDVGICFGQALHQALGDKAGIVRYGSQQLPMDETLVSVALDLGGRPFLVWQAPCPTEKIGEFDTQLVEEFWRAVSTNASMNLHVVLHHGSNSHHIAEAVFKGAARALRQAVRVDERETGVPSTKGKL